MLKRLFIVITFPVFLLLFILSGILGLLILGPIGMIIWIFNGYFEVMEFIMRPSMWVLGLPDKIINY